MTFGGLGSAGLAGAIRAVIAAFAALGAALAHADEPRPLEFTADAFQHMEHWFPMATVANGDTPSTLPDGARLTTAVGKSGPISLDAFNVENGSTGMLVVHDGKVLYEGYWQGADRATRFTSWSMAKSVTSTLAGIALGEGAIRDLRDPVIRYVPQLSDSAYRDVTVEQALQMSSGVWFDETYDSETSDVARFMTLGVRAGNANGFLTTLTAEAAAPGKKFNYNTAETQVVGWVVKNAVGKPLATYLSEKLWQPAGMEDDATWFVDEPGGMEAAGMGLNARLRDYARFGLLMLNDGVVDGRRILPEGWVARATRPSSPQVQLGALYEGYPLGYQYQWWALPNGAFEAQGVFGQFLYVDPAHDLVIAKTSAWPTAWVDDREKAFSDVIDAIVRTVEVR